MSPGCCCFPLRRRDRNGPRAERTRSNGLTSLPSTSATSTSWISPDPIIPVGIKAEEDMTITSLPPEQQTLSENDYSRPLDLSLNFSLRYCGRLQSVQGLQHSEENHQDLIMTIGQAQACGHFIYSDVRNDRIVLNLSKYGIKVMEAPHLSSSGVHYITRWRHSLLEVIRTVHFVDVSNKTFLAIKLGKFGEDVYDSLLFECEETQAHEICYCLQLLFDAVCKPDE